MKINGQQVSSLDDNTHNVSGMIQGVNYEILIDYTMPTTPDVKVYLNIRENNEKGVLSFMVPKFFQGSLIYQGVNKLDSDISMNGNVSINMNLNQEGLNVSIGMDDNSNTGQVSSSSSTTMTSSTTTTSTTTNNNNINPTPANTNGTNSTPTNTVYVDGYSGKIGCSQPVSSERFKSMMESVNNASFAEDQLELAKFAYEHVYDLDNYYKVYNVFSFSKSGEELEEYIDNK